MKSIEMLQESRAANWIYAQLRRLLGSSPSDEELPIADNTADTTTGFMKRELGRSPPALLWAHYMDPHYPFHPNMSLTGLPPSCSRSELAELHDRMKECNAALLTDREMTILQNLYEGNIRYFDRQFASLLSWLCDRPWFADAFIFILADYGELFGEHGRTLHPWDADPYDELLRVPLFVKYPSSAYAGGRLDHLVGHSDLIATIADVLDVDVPLPDGSRPLHEPGGRRILSASNAALRITTSRGSATVRRDGTSTTRGEIDADARQALDQASFPNCETLGGDRPGIPTAELEAHLRKLGYE